MLDPLSFLNWMERAISARKECIEFGYGDYEIIKADHPGVFALASYYKNGVALGVHNLTEETFTVTLEKYFDHLIEYFGDQKYEPLSREAMKLQLGPFGYRWFRRSPLLL
jgi:maltose alpha-D-glucosyltransferase/alpha-amylase